MTLVTGDTLAELNMPVPGYDRRQVTTGIVHIGVGGFHRSHLARIVSLTVTEGGYHLDAVTGEFDASDPPVLADLRPGAAPRTVFGLVTEAYEIDDVLAPALQAAARRQRGHPTAFLEDNRAVFGDLADDPGFTQVYRAILISLHDQGVRKTLADLDHYREDWP